MLRTTKALKPVKLTNNDKATLRLAALIESGRTITVGAAWGYVTVGRYTPAVGPQASLCTVIAQITSLVPSSLVRPRRLRLLVRLSPFVALLACLTLAVESSKEIET